MYFFVPSTIHNLEDNAIFNLCTSIPNLSTSPNSRYTTPPLIFGESSMIQSIQQILPRNLHLGFTLHDTVLESLSEFLPHLIFCVELE